MALRELYGIFRASSVMLRSSRAWTYRQFCAEIERQAAVYDLERSVEPEAAAATSIPSHHPEVVMARVRAKVYVAELKRNAYMPDGITVVLRAVTQGEENKVWASATPQLELSMQIKNPLAGEVFDTRLGKEFYVDFTPIETEG